jgi:DNA modification methylase
MMQLMHGECLELMQDIPAGSVDMVLCDLPYGVTACKWDTVIPMDQLWEQYKRVIKPNGAIVLFGMQPFSAALIMSNPKWFRYEWIWRKNNVTGFLNAKKRPLIEHENILVFSADPTKYYPQFSKADKMRSPRLLNGKTSDNYRIVHNCYLKEDKGERYPKTVLEVPVQIHSGPDKFHPTQKPVPLCEYLIKTYTLEGETVLDNTMGSGTTGVACVNTGRNFIGIELEQKYFEISKQRIEKAQAVLQEEAAMPVQLNLLDMEALHVNAL